MICSPKQKMASYRGNTLSRAALLLMLPWLSLGISCTSRYYCVTKEVKFISMEESPNVYLNATPVKTHGVKNASQCQQFCVKETKCQSINMKANKKRGYCCQLLSANKYSNSSLLVKNDKYSHLYIPSKCDANPCKNGGICVPLYINDSYTCDCKSNGVWISRGKHCETVLDGYKSAFIYYSLDNNVTKKTPHTSTDMDMSAYDIRWKLARVPDRKSPVALCQKGSAKCTEFWRNIPCVNTFTTCKSTVTYSMWVKFQKAQVGKKAHILSRQSQGTVGLTFTANRDSYDFRGAISEFKAWHILDFGRGIVRTKWNQFTFTIDDNAFACAYINGIKEKCQTVPNAVTNDIRENKAIRIGGAWYANSAPMMYVDDFGVWQVALTSEEVRRLKEMSKD